MKKTILFDLDGTLLPMDQEEFTNCYFENLVKFLAPFGYKPDVLIKAIWQGTKKMILNDGKKTNEMVFWDEFCKIFGDEKRSDEAIFRKFYENEFIKIKKICRYNEDVPRLIKHLKEKGYNLIIASNPIFPSLAQKIRLELAGGCCDDFSYITSYENSSFCKPNPLYYKEIIEKNNLNVDECLMIGNDITEDGAALKVGLDVLIVTDCLINKENKDLSKYKCYKIKELLNLL